MKRFEKCNFYPPQCDYRVAIEFDQLHADRVAKRTGKADVPEQELVAAVAVHEKGGTVAVRGRGGRRRRGAAVQVREEQRRERRGPAHRSVVAGNAQGRGRGGIAADRGAAPEPGQVDPGAGARGRLRVVRLRGQRGRVGRSAFAGRAAGRAVSRVVRGGAAGRGVQRRAPGPGRRPRPSDRVQVRRAHLRRQAVRRAQPEHVQH